MDIIERLAEIIGHGLCRGLGDPVPGSLCVEAAICLALGEPHSDQPSCVAACDVSFATVINDACWSSPAARAEGLLPLAIAQLGTAGADRTAWVRSVADGMTRRVLPLAFRAAAEAMVPLSAEHAERLNAAAVSIATGGAGALKAARATARAAIACADASAVRAADADAAARATTYAARAAYSAISAHVAGANADDAAARAADADAADAADADTHAAYAAVAAYAVGVASNATADAAYGTARVATNAAYAARAAYSAGADAVLREAVAVALDAYGATGS